MGYVVDAKNRMIAIKSKVTRQIESRAIFRLLLKDGAPVLFLDRIYSKFPSIPQEHIDAIYKYDVAGTSSLQSLGSPSPFEYEDAAGGITKGAFTIADASLV